MGFVLIINSLAATPTFADLMGVTVDHGEWTTDATWFNVTTLLPGNAPSSADTAAVAAGDLTLQHTVSDTAMALNLYVENTAGFTPTFIMDGSVNSPVLNVGALFEMNRAGGDGTINIIGDNYTGGPGSIDLIRFTTLAAASSTGWDTITIQNFTGVADATVGFDSDSMFLSLAAVPEPSTFTLAALGLLSLGMNRGRRRR